MSKNKNLKSLSERVKRRPLLGDVAKRAGISGSHLSNIIAGRRSVKPETEEKIKEAFRRVMR